MTSINRRYFQANLTFEEVEVTSDLIDKYVEPIVLEFYLNGDLREAVVGSFILVFLFNHVFILRKYVASISLKSPPLKQDRSLVLRMNYIANNNDNEQYCDARIAMQMEYY